MVNFTAEQQVKYYDCCPEPYHSIAFTLTTRRNEHRTAELAMPVVCECSALGSWSVVIRVVDECSVLDKSVPPQYAATRRAAGNAKHYFFICYSRV